MCTRLKFAKILQISIEHRLLAHKRSGLLPPPDSATFRAAEVCTRKTHTRKMHTSVPVCSRPQIPQHFGPQRSAHAERIHAKCTQAFRLAPAPKFRNISGRRGLHTQNAYTQNAHKPSGLLPPQNSATFRAAEVCTGKTHTHKMHTSVPVCFRRKIPQHFGPQCPGKRGWNPTSGGRWELCSMYVLWLCPFNGCAKCVLGTRLFWRGPGTWSMHPCMHR